MLSVTGEINHLRERLTVFEKACLLAVGELTKVQPQVGPTLLQIQGAIMTNDRLIKQFNKLTRK